MGDYLLCSETPTKLPEFPKCTKKMTSQMVLVQQTQEIIPVRALDVL